MNNVYPVTSTRRKGAARGREFNLPPLYEACTRILKTMTSKVAILMYVAIFAVLGQSMAQTCPSTVSLTASTSTYCTDPVTGTATITLTATTDVAIPIGATVRFFRQTVQISPDITVTASNTTNGGKSISYTYQAPVGTSGFDVSILNMPPCANVVSASPAFTSVVNGAPLVVTSGFTNSGPICSGGTATLTFVVTGPTTGNITVNYNQSAPATGPTNSVTLAANASGTTTITVTTPVLTQTSTFAISSITTSAGCSNSSITATSTVTVNSGPTITNIISPQPVCQGGTLQISANVPAPTAGGTNVFAWYKNGVLIGTAASSGTQSISTGSGSTMVLDFSNPLVPSISISNVQPTDAGNYVLQVCNSNYAPCSCSYSNVVTPVINTLPTATITTTSPQTVCYGSGTSISGTYSSTASSVIIQYSINGGAPQTITATGGVFTIAVPATLTANSSNTIAITSITSSGTGGCVNTVLLPNPITVNVRQTTTFGAITPSNGGVFNCNNSLLTLAVGGATTVPAGTTSITYTLTSTSGYNSSTTTTTSPTMGVSFSNLTGSTSGITTYTLTATSLGTGCVTSTTFTVGQVPTAVVVTATAGQITCFGNTTTVNGTVTGGTRFGASPYYTVSLTGLNGAPNYTGIPVTLSGSTYVFTQTGVAAGTYSVVATDANGCTSAAQQLIIVQPQQIVVTATPGVTALTCNGSSTTVRVTATGGAAAGTFTFTLQGGPTPGQFNGISGTTGGTFTNVLAGTYTVQAYDVNGCTVSSAQFTITQPAPITGNATFANPSCPGGAGTITVTATGGGTAPYRFSLTGGLTSIQTPSPTTATAFTFNGLVGGTYTPTIIDANNCFVVLPAVTITTPPAITANVAASSIQCNGGFSTVNITSITGGNGNDPINFTITGTQANGQPFTVNTQGNPIANIPAGTYSITANNPGCPGNAIGTNLTGGVGNLVITQPTAINVSFTAVTYAPVCNATGGSVTVTATGGTGPYTFQLVNASTGVVFGTNATGVFTGLTTGTYNYVVTAANGCQAVSTPSNAATQVVVNVPTQLSVNAPTVSASPICVGGTGTITINATGGAGVRTFTVQLPSGGTQVLTQATTGTAVTFNLPAGTYTITATDVNGCASTNFQVVTLTNPAGSTSADLLLTAAPLTNPPGNIFAAVGSQIGVLYTVTNLSYATTAASGVELVVTRPNPNFTIALDPAYASSWTQTSASTAGLVRFSYIGTQGQLSCGSVATSANIRIIVTEVTAAGKVTFPLSATVNSSSDPYIFNNSHAYNLSTNQ